MTGIRTNQIADDAVTAPKIAELTAKIQYNTATAEGTFSDNKDIVSKKYVDDQILANIEGLTVKQAARVATVRALQASQSGSGVGAYLESLDPDLATPSTLSVDGVGPLTTGDAVLVKDQGGAVFETSPWPAKSGAYYFSDPGEFGRYFEFVRPQAAASYYVWFNSGTGADPAGASTPANQPTATNSIEVDISAATSGEDVATAIKAAIDAESLPGLTVVRYDARLWLVWDVEAGGNDLSTLSDGNSSGGVVTPLSLTLSTVVAGDADGAIGKRNGVYAYTAPIIATQGWRLVRRADFDENAEVTANVFLWVSEGTTNEDTGWVLISDDPLTVDSSGLEFAQFNGAAGITAGDALQKTGNTLDVLFDGTSIGINGSNELEVEDGGISTVKIANDAVTDVKIANDAVTNVKILNGAVGTSKLADYAVTTNKISGDAFAGSFYGGLFLTDCPTLISYTTATNPKPQFAASVDLSAAPSTAFVHGETLAFTGGGTGIFMYYALEGAVHRMYYLPTNATVPTTGAVTGGTAGVGAVHGTPNDQRANTPNGSAVSFDLSIATYNAQEPGDATVLNGSLEVFRNGILQKPVRYDSDLQGGSDLVFYDPTTETIEFSSAPAYGEEIIARYMVQEIAV